MSRDVTNGLCQRRHNDNKITYHNISHLWVVYMFVVFLPRFGTYEIGLKTWKHGHYFKCRSFAGLFFCLRTADGYLRTIAVTRRRHDGKSGKPTFLGSILRDRPKEKLLKSRKSVLYFYFPIRHKLDFKVYLSYWCFIGPILDDTLKEKLLKPWKDAHSSHFPVCLPVRVCVCMCVIGLQSTRFGLGT